MENEERAGSLYHVRYDLADGSGSITIATTRPETMLGDTALMVHPDDTRYHHLIGKTATLPLVLRQIPILADSMVDPKFGTGVVKVTPAHDPNDFEARGSSGEAVKLLLRWPAAALQLPPRAPRPAPKTSPERGGCRYTLSRIWPNLARILAHPYLP